MKGRPLTRPPFSRTGAGILIHGGQQVLGVPPKGLTAEGGARCSPAEVGEGGVAPSRMGPLAKRVKGEGPPPQSLRDNSSPRRCSSHPLPKEALFSPPPKGDALPTPSLGRGQGGGALRPRGPPPKAGEGGRDPHLSHFVTAPPQGGAFPPPPSGGGVGGWALHKGMIADMGIGNEVKDFLFH